MRISAAVTNGRGLRLAGVVGDVGKDYPRTRLGEQGCLGGALSAAGPGDKRDFSGQFLIHGEVLVQKSESMRMPT